MWGKIIKRQGAGGREPGARSRELTQTQKKA